MLINYNRLEAKMKNWQIILIKLEHDGVITNGALKTV